MLSKLTVSIGLLTAIGLGSAVAQTTPDVRNPALGDPGAKPAAPTTLHKPRFHRIPKAASTTGVGPAPDRAAAAGGGH